VLKNDILPTIINDALPKGTMRVKICQLLEWATKTIILSGSFSKVGSYRLSKIKVVRGTLDLSNAESSLSIDSC
jgi:hypothetical protein